MQDFRGRRLLFQRFGEIGRTLAQFVEQPRVLDGDHRLGGEVMDKLDLLVGKRANLLAVQAERADQFVLLQHRNSQSCPNAAKFDGRNSHLIAAIEIAGSGRRIDHLNRGPFRDHAIGELRATHRRTPASLGEGGRRVVRGNEVQRAVVPAIDIAERGVANPHRIRQHVREHRIEIAGRRTDHAQHLRQGALLLARLAEFLL